VPPPRDDVKTIYDELTLPKRDLIPNLVDAGHDVEEIARRSGLQVGTVVHALASALLAEGRVDTAEAVIRSRLADHPTLELHNLLLTCLSAGRRDTRQEYFDESQRWRALRGLDDVEAPSDTFAHLLHDDETLRVGFFCDYTETVFGPTALFPMFRELESRGAEVRVYDFNPAPPSALRVLSWHRSVPGLDTDTLLARIRADRNHVLVDLNGRLRERNRYDVLARRVAPIQINYFNSTTSAGLPAVDALIAADHTVPPSEDRYFVEQVIRLNRYVNGAYRMPTVGRGPGPASQGHPFTFGSFNAGFKLNDDTLRAWSRILRGTPGSRLYIRNQDCDRPRVRARLQAALRQNGVDPSRLITGGFEPLDLMYHRYDDVDLALDPFPHSGGSSSLHALWKGVPALTLQGPDWRGRALSTLLLELGFKSLVTHDEDAYVARAVGLATGDRAELDDIRTALHDRVSGAPFYDVQSVVHQLLDVFTELWQSWKAQHEGRFGRPASRPVSRAQPPGAHRRPLLLAMAVPGSEKESLRNYLLENSYQNAHLGQGLLVDSRDWAIPRLRDALASEAPAELWADGVAEALALADSRITSGPVRTLSVLLSQPATWGLDRLERRLRALRNARAAPILPVLVIDSPLEILTQQWMVAVRCGCPLPLDAWLEALLDIPGNPLSHLRWAPRHRVLRDLFPAVPVRVVPGSALRGDGPAVAGWLDASLQQGADLRPHGIQPASRTRGPVHGRMLAAHLRANEGRAWGPVLEDLSRTWPRLWFSSPEAARGDQALADRDRAAWMVARSTSATEARLTPSSVLLERLRDRFAGDGTALAAQLGHGWTPEALGLPA